MGRCRRFLLRIGFFLRESIFLFMQAGEDGLFFLFQKFRIRVGAARLRADHDHGIILLFHLFEPPQCLLMQKIHPGGPVEFLFCQRAVICLSLGKPGFRPGMAHGSGIEIHHQALQGRIPKSRTEIIHAGHKSRIPAAVGLLQHFSQHVLFKQGRLCLVGLAEGGV